MSITIVRREETKQSGKSATENFKNKVSETDVLKGQMESLAEMFAKNPTDNFTIAENPTTEVYQGDIIIWAKGTDMYNKYISTFKERGKAQNNNLQKGSATTGNHEVCFMHGSNSSIIDGTITLIGIGRGGREVEYDAKLVTTDKPFTVYHKEHGNVTMTAGVYLCSVQMDGKSLRRVQD